ncbi:hypothetical protein DYB32_009135 [Aphanomyces invadans]|uniref:LNR domain-containing protein n=1 Tax=Aphanomyces invadans TaxID=157072 RepID=A0A418AJ75_9STRA|nr:hypothetical protein DYB32_009135 [Aphanomyces invadans]
MDPNIYTWRGLHFLPQHTGMAPRIVAVQSAARPGQSVDLVEMIQPPTLALARAKHVISALYFALTAMVYVSSTSEEQHSVHVYAPGAMIGINLLLTLLHLYGFGRTYGYFTCLRLHIMMARPGYRRRWRLPKAVELPLIHTIDVVCQSYQAYRMSLHMVNRIQAFVFTVTMSLYCLVTPWFLMARHGYVRQSAVLIVNSFLGFFLSVAFPMCTFLIPIIRLLLVRRLQKHDKYVTETLLLGRHMVVSSLGDLISKTTIQLSSYIALRRLVESVDPVKSVASTAMSTKELRRPSGWNRIRVYVRTPRRLLVVYVAANVAWGVALIALTTAATFFRTECPLATCALDVAPWFDLTCHCAYVEINCATTGEIAGDTIDHLLDAHVIGTSVFFLDIRRCPLPHGIAMTTLTPFHQLHAIFIYFSNMTDWPMDDITFPSTMTALHIRGSQLRTLPPVLSNLPPSLVYLRVQDSPIDALPDVFLDAWMARLSSLTLAMLHLTSLSPRLTSMAHIALLDFRGNNISTLPRQWTATDGNETTSIEPLFLASVDLSANSIVDGPWALVNENRVSLELSSNPISSIHATTAAETLETRLVVVDDTPYCRSSDAGSYCQVKCARLCLATMIGDFRCDYECYNPSCDFDGGDCDGFGFD